MGDKGFGLIAEKFIGEHTLIIEYIGELVTEAVYQERLKTKQTNSSYFMKYGNHGNHGKGGKGKLYIDAERKGNMSRFMNHSCNPNCEPRTWSVKGIERIGLFALRDITEVSANENNKKMKN